MNDPLHPDPALVLTAELRRAFRDTHYRFETPAGMLLLQIDCGSEPLRRLLAECGQRCAAAITAYNPGSQPQDDDSNRHAQRQLESELRTMGLTCFPGRHEDPQGHWLPETSTLALGLPCATARRIAIRYGQLAIVWSDAGGTPQLIETSGAATSAP